ncbi:hypothetical protein J1C67_07630 [Clostridium gasigenes]|uniref:alpha/beta fold hydrolase n=1 Tax=Clostridium gasigenes TaxID=94869 RepID=UPI00143829CB|nr:hypothetical protein [Clostridium gasigenes]NKF06689.1 hypothetical protein [Clostridium gasigenes]QSW20962.1 hypothetical protein J1C67_07630 [Clostridium gasigenes]
MGWPICLGVSSKNIPAVTSSVIISSGASFPKLDKAFMSKIHEDKIDFLYLLKCLGSLFNPIVQKALALTDPFQIIINDFLVDEYINVESQLENISTPPYVIVGGDEILTLVEYSKLIVHKVTDSKLIVVPQIRHIFPLVKATYISRLVKDFIK